MGSMCKRGRPTGEAESLQNLPRGVGGWSPTQYKTNLGVAGCVTLCGIPSSKVSIRVTESVRRFTSLESAKGRASLGLQRINCRSIHPLQDLTR